MLVCLENIYFVIANQNCYKINWMSLYYALINWISLYYALRGFYDKAVNYFVPRFGGLL